MSKKHNGKTSILHEKANNGMHRLVLFKNGVADYSPWHQPTEIGVYRGYRFTVQGNEAIPSGVFKVLRVESQGF